MSAVLAKWLASKAVKEQLRASGIRYWWDCEAKDISKLANIYLAEHPELWNEARLLCAKLESDARRKRR